MLAAIRNFAKKNIWVRKMVGYYLASSGLFDNFFRNYKVSSIWQNRISSVLQSDDNAFIPKVAGAGEIISGKQLMHNGLKIHLGSYYGPEYAKMLLLSGGVHEPQEERVFMEALKTLKPGSVMLEMGAFWSFYSMWFQKAVTGARNFMVEPDEFNLGQGRRNFRLNKMHGTFIKAFVGKCGSTTVPGDTLCVDQFMVDNKIDFLHMLHSDIQGYEYEMLLGAEKTLAKKQVGYVFISTHSNDLHYKCLQYLEDRSFNILASADLDETFSEDGLIAARAPYFPGIDKVLISKRQS